MAANGNGKQKRKIFFIIGNGTFTNSNAAPGDRKVPSNWNPGKSKNKYKKLK